MGSVLDRDLQVALQPCSSIWDGSEGEPRALEASHGQDRDKLPHRPEWVCCSHPPQEKRR